MNRASYVVLLPLGAKKKTTRIEVLENGTVIAGEAHQGAVAIARKPSLAELEAAYGAFERRVAKFQDTFAERTEEETNASDRFDAAIQRRQQQQTATAKCEASRDACAKALKAAEPVKATHEFDHPQPPYVWAWGPEGLRRFVPAEPVKATHEFEAPYPVVATKEFCTAYSPYVCIMRFTPAHAACLKTRKGLGYTVMDLSPKTAPTE